MVTAPNELKPVMLFLHGGSFVSGDASDSFSDGGNLASRGDVVVVVVNYRLGLFGFLALDDGSTSGNYGLGDQISALQWLNQNIAHYGGDPSRITVFGQSAGASSLRALLSSSMTRSLIHGAIMQSSPGGRGTGRPYSNYLSISEAMQYINPALRAVGCADKSHSQLSCLKALSADKLATGSRSLQLEGVNQAFLVQDGSILNKPALDFKAADSTPRLPLLLGTMRDDGAFFLPESQELNLASSLLRAPLTLSEQLSSTLSNYANISSSEEGLFLNNTTNTAIAYNVFNITNQISSLGIFSCSAYATVQAAAAHDSQFTQTYTYQMHRAYNYYPEEPACNAPVTKQYPYGNPYTSYDCHSGDNAYVFGNLAFLGFPERDEHDMPFSRQTLDSWASFARTGDPNPDPVWMQAMGYTLEYGLGSTDTWSPSSHATVNIRRLGPIGSAMIGAPDQHDLRYCNLMGLSQDMYL